MIITCASCLTKFNLDDSRIPAIGAKVRCSRCKHVFYVVPPSETKEETLGDFETFAKYHEDRMPEQEKKGDSPPQPREERTRIEPPPERGEVSPLQPEVSGGEMERELAVSGEEIEEEPLPPPVRPSRAGRKGPSMVFALVVILLLIVFGLFYLSTELGPGGRLSSYVEPPMKKMTQAWHQIWGTENEGLIVGDFTRYEENVGGTPVSVIEGRVNNQSGFTKKHIRVKVVIYDREKVRIAEKEAICGRVLSRSELRSLPPDFFRRDLIVKPQTEGEMTTPSGRSIPFAVVFKDLPSDAREFKVEIVEAPNL